MSQKSITNSKKFSITGLVIGIVFIVLLIILLCVFLVPGVVVIEPPSFPGTGSGTGSSSVVGPYVGPSTSAPVPVPVPVLVPITLSPIGPAPATGTLAPSRISTWAAYVDMINNASIDSIFLLSKEEFDVVMADGIKTGAITQTDLDNLPYDKYILEFAKFITFLRDSQTSSPGPISTSEPYANTESFSSNSSITNMFKIAKSKRT